MCWEGDRAPLCFLGCHPRERLLLLVFVTRKAPVSGALALGQVASMSHLAAAQDVKKFVLLLSFYQSGNLGLKVKQLAQSNPAGKRWGFQSQQERTTEG